MKIARLICLFSCCLAAVSCDDSADNVPLNYPPTSTGVSVAPTTAVTAFVNTPKTFSVAVLNPPADLRVAITTPPANGTLTVASQYLGVTYTSAVRGTDSAALLITSASDPSIQLRTTLAISVITAFETLAPEQVNVVLNVPFAFTGGNAITVTHEPADDLAITETVTADIGSLALGVTAGIEFVDGDDEDDLPDEEGASIVFTGSLSAVNAALASLTLTVPADYDTTVEEPGVHVLSDDNTTDALGTPQQSTADIAIVIGSASPLSVTAPATATTNEDTALIFNNANGNALIVNDSDIGPTGQVTIDLSAENGTLTLAGTSGLTFTQGDGTGDATVHFSGSRSSVQAALATVTYAPALNVNGAGNDIVFSAQSTNGNDTTTIVVSITAVNDAPTLAYATPFPAVGRNAVMAFTGSRSVVVSDVDSTNVTLVITTTTGTFTLSGSGTGSGTNMVTLTGTISQVNNAIAGMTYRSGDAANDVASETEFALNDGAGATPEFTITLRSQN